MKRRDQDFGREYTPYLDSQQLKFTPHEFLFESSNNFEFDQSSKQILFENINEELGFQNWTSECKPELTVNNKDVWRSELSNCLLNNLFKYDPEYVFYLTSKFNCEIEDFQAYSQMHELSLDFNIKTSPRWASAKPANFDSSIEPKELAVTNSKIKNSVDSCTDPIEETKNKEAIEIEDESNKITMLWNVLKSFKGVKIEMIDRDIIKRTYALGQEFVAKQLNIPYRRFKLILNKAGFKINAGRKVKSPILEWELIEWIKQTNCGDRSSQRNLIKKKAQEIRKELIRRGNQSIKKFKFSKGWLDKFLKRNELL